MPVCHYCGANHYEWNCPLREISNKVSSISGSMREQAFSTERNSEYLSAITDYSSSISYELSDITGELGGVSDAIYSIEGLLNNKLSQIIFQNRNIIESQESFLRVQKIQSVMLGAGLIIATISFGSIIFKLFQPRQRRETLEEINIAEECIKNDDLGRALKHIERAIDSDPRIPQAWMLKAHCFLQTKRFNQVANILRNAENWTKEASEDIRSKIALMRGRYYFSLQDEEGLQKSKDKYIEALILDNENLEAGFQLVQNLFVSASKIRDHKLSNEMRAKGIVLLSELGDIDPLYIRRFEVDPSFSYDIVGIVEIEGILRGVFQRKLSKSLDNLKNMLKDARGLLSYSELFDETKKKIKTIMATGNQILQMDSNLSEVCVAFHDARNICNECSSILDRFIDTFVPDYRPKILALRDRLESTPRVTLGEKKIKKLFVEKS